MFNFSAFYQSGGVLMHPITLTAVVALTALFLDARARKLGDDNPRRLRLADRLLIFCVGIGLIGTTMNVTELFAALSMAPPERYFEALARGGAIVVFPLTWSLMLALPLWIATSVMYHRAPGSARATPTG